MTKLNYKSYELAALEPSPLPLPPTASRRPPVHPSYPSPLRGGLFRPTPPMPYLVSLPFRFAFITMSPLPPRPRPLRSS